MFHIVREKKKKKKKDLNSPLRRTAFAQSAFSFMAIKHCNMLSAERKTCRLFSHYFFHGVEKMDIEQPSHVDINFIVIQILNCYEFL